MWKKQCNFKNSEIVILHLEKNANLVYEVAADVRFGYELANHTHESFGHSMTATVSLVTWLVVFFVNTLLKLCFFSFENIISLPSSLPHSWKIFEKSAP
jgi:hypothetical protein